MYGIAVPVGDICIILAPKIVEKPMIVKISDGVIEFVAEVREVDMSNVADLFEPSYSGMFTIRVTPKSVEVIKKSAKKLRVTRTTLINMLIQGDAVSTGDEIVNVSIRKYREVLKKIMKRE